MTAFPSISSRVSRFIRSLRFKKHRLKEGAFVIEGAKGVHELLASNYEIKILVATPAFIHSAEQLLLKSGASIFVSDAAFLASLGNFQTNDSILAVASCKPNLPIYIQPGTYGLVLDNIRDPGNLGTIFRIANWYGIRKLICSNHTIDRYNPKVLQASMGAFTDLEVYYTSLPEYLEALEFPILGAMLLGDNVHEFKFPSEGVFIIGNESQGISKEILPYLDYKVNIPRYGQTESLNAAMATAILCDNWRRGNG